jgi:lipopolysaccharide exporter
MIISLVKGKLLKNAFIKNVILLMSGTAIAQILPIVISPFLTRLYSPGDFGIFAIFISIISIISILVTGRYELAIILPKEEKESINIFAFVIILTSLSTIFIFFVLFFGRELLVTLFNISKIYLWIFFIPISLFLTGCSQALNYWFNRKKQFNHLSKGKIIQAIVNSFLSLLLGLIVNGSNGIIISTLVGQFISTLFLLRIFIIQEKEHFKSISLECIREQIKKYKKFPKYTVFSDLLNSLSVQAPVFLLTHFFGSKLAGYYSLSNRTINMPLTLVGNSVAQVFYQSATESKDNLLRLKEKTYKIYKKLLFLAIIPVSLLLWYGDNLFSLFFGNSWVTSGSYTQYLIIWMLFVFVSSPLSQLLSILEKQFEGLIFNIIIFFTRIISILFGALIFRSDKIAVLLFGITGALFWFAFSIYLLKQVEIKIKESLYFTLKIIIVTIFILGIPKFISFFL